MTSPGMHRPYREQADIAFLADTPNLKKKRWRTTLPILYILALESFIHHLKAVNPFFLRLVTCSTTESHLVRTLHP